MRHGNDSGHPVNPFIREIGHVAMDFSRHERGAHILVIHEEVAGKVQDIDSVLHLCERLGVKEIFRTFEQRDMYGDIIALRKNLVQGFHRYHAILQSERMLYGKIDIIAVNGHAEGNGAVCDEHADRAESDYPQFFPCDFLSCEGFFALFDGFRNISFKSLGPMDSRDDIPAGKQQRGDDEFLDPVCVCAGSRSRHGQKRIFRLGFMQGAASYQCGVRCRKILSKGICVIQLFKPAGGYFIETFNFIGLTHGRVPPQIFS